MMKKSVYSLVLMDDVVDAIDRMAYSMNTSRSNLINQILAERVSFVTPEMRMRDIFSRIEKLMDSRFQMLEQPSEAMMSVKSPLKYKYKPTIKYSVELFRSFEGGVGRLKVSFRTQSRHFIDILNQFFILWHVLENEYLESVYRDGVPWELRDINFTRDFYAPNPEKLTDDDIAKAIGSYIVLLDECIKIFFERINNIESAKRIIEDKYRKHLKKGLVIV